MFCVRFNFEAGRGGRCVIAGAAPEIIFGF